MDPVRGTVYATVGMIVAVTVVSGPLVGAVDLSHERYDTAGLGEGTAAVAAVDAPDGAAIERAGYGSETYYLEVPDATVRFSSIRGQPLVAYKISIPGLNYSRGTTHFLSERHEGRVALSIERDAFAADQLDRSQYDARLTIVLRASDTETTLYDEPITVAVSS